MARYGSNEEELPSGSGEKDCKILGKGGRDEDVDFLALNDNATSLGKLNLMNGFASRWIILKQPRK